MKIQRKARNKMSKKIDILKPVTLDMLGTEEDPCFGKFNDPKSPECSRCGDCELCAIVMQQNLHLKRAKIEAESKFKDLEEKDMQLADPKKVRKMVKRRVRELAKMKPNGQSVDFIIDDVHAIYVMHGYTKKRIRRIIDTMIEKSSQLSIKNNTIKFHKP